MSALLRRRIRPIFEFCQQIRHLPAKLAAVDDHVDCTMIEQEFAALKSFRQFLPNRLFDDSRAGKSNQCPGLGNIDIAKHGKTG